MIHPRLEDLIIGVSPIIRELRAEIRRAAPRAAPVLIQGPTGAGKELVAQGLHYESARRGLLVTFNAAAIPDSLFESELLGHVRGAFTGAIGDRAGLLRRAATGTAFMDEVGDLSLVAQAKLLRVIESREVCPVGAERGVNVDFRLVTATNVNLSAAVAAGEFRHDLLFRLRGIQITVPALRDHREDIPLLAAHFARAVAADNGCASLILTPSALEALDAHSWPGNVRELKQTVEHAAFLADGGVIRDVHVEQSFRRDDRLVSDAEVARDRIVLADLLEVHRGDVDAVARALGVDRSTAYRRMHRLGVRVGRRGPRKAGWPSAGECKAEMREA